MNAIETPANINELGRIELHELIMAEIEKRGLKRIKRMPAKKSWNTQTRILCIGSEKYTYKRPGTLEGHYERVWANVTSFVWIPDQYEIAGYKDNVPYHRVSIPAHWGEHRELDLNLDHTSFTYPSANKRFFERVVEYISNPNTLLLV